MPTRDRQSVGALSGSRASHEAASSTASSPFGFDPERKRLPFILRALIRVSILVSAFFAIGVLSAAAESFRWFSHDDITLYRGGLNMLLILWFMGLLESAAIAQKE